jgi:hypothetical protein
MTEKELIGKIIELRQIKPKKDWVFSVKKEILGEEPKMNFSTVFKTLPRLIFSPKVVFAGVLSILIFFGVFTSAQNSLPGDLLYPIKKITEKAQLLLASENEKQMIQLELTNKRLEELSKIAEKNQVEKLAPAIEEYQASVSQAAKNIKKITNEVIQRNQQLEKTKAAIELSLGVKIEDTEDYRDSLSNKIAEAQIAEAQLKDLEGSSLNEVQKKTLKDAKQALEDGNYRLTLELIQLLPSQR